MRKLLTVGVLLLAAILVFGSPGRAEELNVLYMAQAGYQPEDISQMTKVFEEVVGEDVNVTYVKYDEMHDKIVTSAAVPKGTYDVVLEDLIWTAKFGEYGFVEPLDDRVNETILKDIPEAVLDAFRYDGNSGPCPFWPTFSCFSTIWI